MRKSILFTLVAIVIATSACTNADKETPGLTGDFVRTQGDKLVEQAAVKANIVLIVNEQA